MKYLESKKRFIDAWGALGSSWGVPRTMSQIHALLMISPEAMTTDEIMEDLGLSRGNVSMGLKALEDWGIIHLEYKHGERKKFYRSEKDVMKIATQIAKERKKRELEPIIDMLKDIENVKDPKAKQSDVDELNKMTSDIKEFAEKTDGMLSTFIKSEKNWFYRQMMKWV